MIGRHLTSQRPTAYSRTIMDSTGRVKIKPLEVLEKDTEGTIIQLFSRKFVVALVFQENTMTNVKRVDCALLPPCAKTVHNKMQRAHFISILWGNALSIIIL